MQPSVVGGRMFSSAPVCPPPEGGVVPCVLLGISHSSLPSGPELAEPYAAAVWRLGLAPTRDAEKIPLMYEGDE
jgi:hypothetical protein